MKNILVVGVDGMIGAALFAELQKSSVACVWGSSKREANDKRNIIFLDLKNPSFTPAFSAMKFDVVYVCAGVCRMALCEDDPAGTRQVNINGMTALLRRLNENAVFIVFLSTNQVFSGDDEYVLPNANYQPRNEYGRQKVEMEKWIQANCDHWAIVRLTKVLEPGMNLIKGWLNDLGHGKHITCFNDMIFAPISLGYVVHALQKIGDAKRNGIYQLSGKQDISYAEAAYYLANHLALPQSLVHSISAKDSGFNHLFLPRFTTLDCSGTTSYAAGPPPHYSAVLQECFDLS